eukprot:8367434-Pyramimonas_sp.AAC.1
MRGRPATALLCLVFDSYGEMQAWCLLCAMPKPHKPSLANISMAKDPTICSCEYRNDEYLLRAVPLSPSVELPMGPWNAALGG